MKIDEPRTGKSLIFTDLHVGISNDRESRQKIAENVIDEIIERISIDGIQQVFFLGDLFHQRTSIEVTSLNVANDLVRKLSSCCEVFLLQGNHDLYEKHNSAITSLNIFDLPNVHVVSTPTELTLNSQKVLLVPWLCGSSIQTFIDQDGLSDRYDIMMGHFDISYAGDIQRLGGRYEDGYRQGTMNMTLVETDNIISEILHHTNDFSTVYMGHIHEHDVVTFANRVWNIVGSPQFQVHDMMRMPDSRKHHGYYILNESNEGEFHDCASVPRFVTLYASDMVNGTLDESRLKGAIVRRCYDVILNDEQKSRLDEIVTNANVYEEDSSVFVLGVNESSSSSESDGELGDVSVMDKFDYIRNQVEKISHPAIDNDRLMEMMKDYYNRALNQE